MEDFEKKVSISEAKEPESMDVETNTNSSLNKAVVLLKRFLHVQQSRAQSYSKLKRGFDQYMASGDELAYQQLCSAITAEFSDCSLQVIELESLLLGADCLRDDLACLLKSVQLQEKKKLEMTVTIQVLKKAGRPSERLVSHDTCKFNHRMGHECIHIHKITEGSGTEEAEADSEYDNALKEAIKGVQDAVIKINDHLEEVRYEIADLEDE